MEQKYANILFDDAFKVVVCAPGNEELLARIIELMVPGKTVTGLELREKENHGLSVSDKITNFDLFCTSDTGEQFIVEMQFSPQNNYADRMLCYATYPIRAQLSKKLAERREKAEKGGSLDKMDYGLMPVYVISLLDFSIRHESGDVLENGLVSRYAIRNARNGELMTEALQFVYLELGRLKMTKDEPQQCRTLLEKFAFSLKYMHELPERPVGFEEDILKMLYNAAEFANMPVERQTEYEIVMRNELDIIAEKNYAREEGRVEGRAEGKSKASLEIAEKLLQEGIPIEVVQRATGLSKEEIEELR
jgi:hypothetical protein